LFTHNSGPCVCDRGAKNATGWLINNANCGNATRRVVLATSRFETNRTGVVLAVSYSTSFESQSR